MSNSNINCGNLYKDTLTSLNKLISSHLEDNPKGYIYRSQVLLPAFTFAFYGICDGALVATIYNLPQISHGRRKGRKPKYQPNCDYMAMRRRLICIPNDYQSQQKRETIRIKDLIFWRVEGCNWGERRLESKYVQLAQEEETNHESVDEHPSLTNNSTTPSTEALPVFWA